MAKDSRLWIGFDLGGTKMLCHVYDSQFNLLASNREKTRGHKGVEQGVERIVDTIEEALSNLQFNKEELGGIGIGCPGPLDLDAGIIRNAPNLGWSDVPIKSTLESEFGCSAHVINDVDAGVYGEYRFGAGRGARCLVGVFPGTGIGGGCIYEGEILRGRTGSCMEVGHMQILPEGPVCGCGRQGCLETLASRLAIAAEASKAAYRGDAPYLMQKFGADLTKIRSKALAEAIKNGDQVIETIVSQAAHSIGIAVGNLVNLLLPDVIVMGGGLVEAMPDHFLKPVQQSARQSAMPSFADEFRVVAAKLGDDAGVLGCAAWAQHSVA